MIPDSADQRPTYRYLEPPPAPSYGAFGRGVRWALLLGAVAWFLIFLAGFLIAGAAT